MVQFSHPYLTIGKTIALTIRTLVNKVMSLLFNRFVIASSKEQASFNFMAAVMVHNDSGAQENSLSFFLHLFAMKLLKTKIMASSPITS